MVDSTAFFSTMAPAFGSIVAFLVAISAALYTVERQRVERRTENYRESLIDLKETYNRPLTLLIRMLRNEGAESPENTHLTRRNDEIKQAVEEEVEEMVATSLLLSHLDRISWHLSQVRPENDHILEELELLAMKSSSSWLYDHFYELSPVSEEFYEEVSGKQYEDVDHWATEDILSDNVRAFQLKKHISHILKDTYTNQYYGQDEDDPETHEDITGANYWSLKSLFEQLIWDIEKARRESSGSVIDYNSGIRPIATLSTYLIMVGVIIPTGFLISPPTFLQGLVIPDNLLTLVQLLLLSSALALSVALIEIILRSTQPQTNIGDINDLSWFSETVVNLLPRLPFE